MIHGINIFYYKMFDREKKSFFQKFIKSIEIYPDKALNEDILKWIISDFRCITIAKRIGASVCPWKQQMRR